MKNLCSLIKIGITTTFHVACTRIIYGLLFLSIFITQGCGDEGSGIGGSIGLTPPPVSITFRESLIDGYVLQLNNTSNHRIVARVFVENKSLGQQKSCSVGIAPNAVEELGLLEMSWCFQPGENGHVSVDGYPRGLDFELMSNGRYRVW